MDDIIVNFNFLHSLISIIGLVLMSSIQLLAIWYIKGITYYKSLITGFLCGFVFVLFFEFYFLILKYYSLSDSTALSLVNILSYLFLSFCYLCFIQLGVSALRIRLLQELYNSSNGLTMDEILGRYNSKQIIDYRVKRLINNGQIIIKRDRYYAKMSVTLIMAMILEVFRFIILGKKSRIKFIQVIKN